MVFDLAILEPSSSQNGLSTADKQEVKEELQRKNIQPLKFTEMIRTMKTKRGVSKKNNINGHCITTKNY